MKKNRTLRLGSFEQLESRALLAHAGLPQTMSMEMHEDRQFADFSRGPRSEVQARSIDARAAFVSAHAPRNEGGFRGDFSPPNHSYSDSASSGYISAISFETAPPIIFVTSAPVLIIVTISSSPQFSEPLSSQTQTSSVRNNPPQSQRVSSFSNPPSNNLQSTPSANRSTSTSQLSLKNSLSVFSDTALKRTASTDSSESDDSETTGQAAQDDNEPTRDEQESQQLIRQQVANETALQTTEADSDADLIELDPAELLKRTKRKSARAAAATKLEASPARDSALHLESRLPRAAELQPTEIWLNATQVDEVCVPVNDEFIELLAGDQVKSNASPASSAIPFTTPTLHLEANLGFHQAAELTDAAIPVEAQPAAVAAAALPAREAQ